MTLGVRLISTLLEVHQGLIRNALSSTTITDAWVRTGEVFGWFWTEDTVMEEVGKVIEVGKVVDSQEELTQSMSTPKNITVYWER